MERPEMMTRKDYEWLADTINKVQKYVPNDSMRALIRSEFHESMSARYDNYDALKFYEALDTE
jgi:hypothetical protein